MAASTTPDLITYPTTTDQAAPLATVFANVANSVQTAFTNFRKSTAVKAASDTERNTRFPTPVQGDTVYRTDIMNYQRYYGVYNATTNPGGKASAGWYNDPVIYGVTIAGNADANGFTSNVTHTLGKTPDWVMVTPNNVGTDAVTLITSPVVWSKTATTVQIRMRRTDSNQYFANPYNVTVLMGTN